MGEPLAIVGMGEIGRRFATAANSLHLEHQDVTRESGQSVISAAVGVPVLVCVRETELAEVLRMIPPARAADLIVVQNGFIDELIEPYAQVTRAVLWFTSKGTFFADILQSPVYGPRADLVRRLINAAGGSAETITDQDVFRRYALEKAVWSCVVGAPLAVWGIDLATARHERMAEIETIVREACDVVRVALGVDIPPGRVLATLDDTSKQLGWMRGGTTSIGWRNAKVVEWGNRCGIPTPANQAIVDAAPRQSERTVETE